MALITCNNCGKSISDKTEVCIHCGTPLKAAEPPAPQKPKVSSNEESKLKNFKHLSAGDRNRLESEFLKTDKWAYAYRRREIEIKKLGSFAFWTPVACVATLGIILFLGRNTEASLDLSNLAGVFFGIGALTIPVAFCLMIYNRIYVAKKMNKAMYNKRLQSWLLREKNLSYNPNFISEKEKQLFDEITIDEGE